MAFVRTKDVYGHKYYQLVESYRENGKVRQRVLAHLGESASLEEAVEATAVEIAKLREMRQALLDEREGILLELHQKLPNVMEHHGGVPPVLGQFLTSPEYQTMQGMRGRYFDFQSDYSRPPSVCCASGVRYTGYYGFMGACGRYHRIPKEVETLEARIERTEERLEKLRAVVTNDGDARGRVHG